MINKNDEFLTIPFENILAGTTIMRVIDVTKE